MSLPDIDTCKRLWARTLWYAYMCQPLDLSDGMDWGGCGTVGGRWGAAHGHAESSGAFLAFAEPPYWMRMFSAHSVETFVASHARSSLCVSCACSADAETPVPMAQTCGDEMEVGKSICACLLHPANQIAEGDARENVGIVT